MQKLFFYTFLLVFIFSFSSFSQTEKAVYFKDAIKQKRNSVHKNIIQNTINKNLSLALNDETEDNWMDAFSGMELLNYRSQWADSRINLAVDSIEKRSTGFQRALIELVYTSYPKNFIKQLNAFLPKCTNAKVFAMGCEYIMLNSKLQLSKTQLEEAKKRLVKNEKDEAIFQQLSYKIENNLSKKTLKNIDNYISPEFLKNQTILYSFQRKNRNYTGIALIRDSIGNFIKDEIGNVFSVPQLARSVNNLPGYLTNGNTPQGIFRMFGLDTSKSGFIGPTTNIQLTMPFETNLQHFLNDSTITDTVWTIDQYKKLLPKKLKNTASLYESFYAGKAGRTEIIAHGTTVNPQYYVGKTYYPHTPTMGCLCTKELWSETDGRRLESDQQKLVNALNTAGGANGYCVVIEIDDAQKPVTLNDILSLLKQQQIK